MFFDIVRGAREAIHKWTAPPREKDEPVAPPAKPSKPEGATPATPPAPEKFVNPYDPTSRYRHLKETDGSWRKVSKDKDWTPWQPPAPTLEMEVAEDLYKLAEEKVIKIEKTAQQTPSIVSLDEWNDVWKEVNNASSYNVLALKDRLLTVHPEWEKVDAIFEYARPDHERYDDSRQDAASQALEEMNLLARRLAQVDFGQLPRFFKKLRWYERRLDDVRKTSKELSNIRGSIGRIESSTTPKTDTAKNMPGEERVWEHTHIVESFRKDKNKGRAQDLMRAQYARLQKDLRETAFLVERELAATLPRQQVGVAMQQVREGTYRVAVMTRARDWFSSRLGKLAGHQSTHSLYELVEKYREMSQTMEKIEADLQIK